MNPQYKKKATAVFPMWLSASIAASAALLTQPVSGNDGKNAIVEETEVEETSAGFYSFSKWDSRYASEGRDNLNGASIYSFQFSKEFGDWLIGAWFGFGDEADYEERNFTIERNFEFAGFTGFVGYSHLQFPGEEDGSDNEIGAGLSGPEILPGLSPEINWYYSFGAGGSYLEFGLKREFVLSDRLSVTIPIMMGRNDRYISDGHRGFDHVRITVEMLYKLSENVAIQAHVGESFAINSSPGSFAGDEPLKDFFHAGVGISVSF